MSVYGGPEINDSGLILHLDASNPKSYPGSGTTWFDLSGNGNHSTLSGFVSNPVFSYRYGGSFYFNGPTSKSHITCSTNNGLTNLSNFTIIMWGALDDFAALPNARYYAFDSRVNPGSTSSGLGFDRKNVTYTSPFHFAEDATGYDETSGPTAFVKNNMYMFGLTRNGSAIQIIDTDSVTLISPSLVTNSLGTGNISFNGYRIGTYAGAGSGTGEYWWPGHICAVYVYNRVLTQAEVAQHYTAARSRFLGLQMSLPDIPGMKLWLDASDSGTLFSDTAGTTLATADGTAVALWKDKSGNLNHASQATAGNRPVVKLAVQNNLNVIRFDGSNDFIQPSSFAVGPQPVTVFTVFKTNGTGYHTIYDTGSAKPMMWIDGIGRIELDYPSTYTTSSSVVNSNTLFTYVNSSSGGGLRLNGSTIASTYSTSLSSSATSFFNRSGGQTYKGDFYEMLIYNSALTTVQQLQVEAYLNTKWNIY